MNESINHYFDEDCQGSVEKGEYEPRILVRMRDALNPVLQKIFGFRKYIDRSVLVSLYNALS